MKNGHWQGILFLSTVAPVIEEESRDLLNMVDVLLSPGVTWWQSQPGGWQGPWQPVRARLASGSPQSGLDNTWSSMLFGFAMSMTKTKTIRSSFQSLGNPWQLISHNLPNNTSCKLYSLKNFERPNQDCPHNRQQAAKTINLHKYCQKPVQTNIEPTGSNRHTACKK